MELLNLLKMQVILCFHKNDGEGYFVEPVNGQIYSPVTGKISSVFPTKHAIGITTANGLEILLHMGINTVDLGGKPFDLKKL